MKRGKLFIISGPSGVGKTTAVNALLEDEVFKMSLKRVITYTTRPRREHEVDGVDYNFISQNDFKEKIREHFFLEFSTWYNYYYGTPASFIKGLEKGCSFIMILDRMGAREIVRLYPKTVTIWLQVSSLDILKQRLLNRQTETASGLMSRLEKAQCEQSEENAQHFYTYHITQDELGKTIEQLKTIIIEELANKNDDIFQKKIL